MWWTLTWFILFVISRLNQSYQLLVVKRSFSGRGALSLFNMGNKSSLLLREEEIAQIQEETGCKSLPYSIVTVEVDFLTSEFHSS